MYTCNPFARSTSGSRPTPLRAASAHGPDAPSDRVAELRCAIIPTPFLEPERTRMAGPGDLLLPGAYESLVTRALARAIDGLPVEPSTVKLDEAEAAGRLTHHLAGLIEAALASVPAARRPAAQVELANRLVEWLGSVGHEAADEVVVMPPRVLRLVTEGLLPGQAAPPLPDVPLLDHDLLANAPGEPAFAHALGTELATADRVDAVIAFVRWTGLNLIRTPLGALIDRGVPVRLLTTTFTGSTERKALDWLVARGVHVKVSYDVRTTRLHAKAWLVHRDTGFSSAYVGSSNLSRAALVDGIEWNVRLVEATAPAVFGKLRATFESLWNDESFEAYDPARDAERFDETIRRTSAGAAPTGVSGLEVRPWPYQREMLEALVVERARFGRTRNLVVAPTGTGKTVVAALDYRVLRDGQGGLGPSELADASGAPTLLFIAHREQILEQALQTFRDVLADGSFGEKFVGGQRPHEWRHVFASVQSLSAMEPDALDPARFAIVYVDEFHHAEARTYRRLMERLRPRVMVGLTATPERADGTNVRDLFDGRYAFEMRLWDALDQQLLAPFHYFGVADGTDLSKLRWERGGYRTSDLESRYVVTGHDARTAKVLAALRDRIADVRRMRAFGFCVSVKHAHHMAGRFTRAGIPAVTIDGSTPVPERRRHLDALRRGDINVVFAVDVLSEGVDVPEVDTILLLRPTESATVFLQQIGRGLRLHAAKEVCTVLDFIGQQHGRFRGDLRLRALTGRSRGQLVRDARQGFPFLPSGCHIRLERQAETDLIANLKAVASPAAAVLARELARHEGDLGRRVTLAEFLDAALVEAADVYRHGSWTELRRRAGVEVEPAGPREAELSRGLKLRLQDIDDPERLAMSRLLAAGEMPPADARSQRLASMLGFVLFDDGRAPDSVAGVVDALHDEPALRRELAELADVLEERARVLTRPSELAAEVPLHVHATYGRGEVLVALGDRVLGDVTAHREGVKRVEPHDIDVLFVTLEKSERDYSPTTRYRDYAVSTELFHWESQSGTTRRSPTGRRYLDGTSTVLLFVRRTRKDASGRAPGFLFLGPVTRVADRGEKPISITWRLARAMPESWFAVAKAAAG